MSGIFRKLKATIEIWGAKDIYKTIHIAPDCDARAIIDETLRKRLKVENTQQGLVLKAISDEILSRLKRPSNESMDERVNRLVDGAISQAFWFHGQLAGLTTLWEFRVRFLALKLGIKSNAPIEEKTNMNRANRSVQHRPLSEVIKDINRKTNHRLSLKLPELAELRNAIVHCNPQGIKAYAKPLLGKDVFKKIRGNVVVFRFDTKSLKNLSDVQNEVEIENEDLFGFFLETYNSEMPQRAFKLFEESIRQVDLLTELSSVSFDERSSVFEDLMLTGKWPDKKMVTNYQQYFSSPTCPMKRDADEFFAALSKCFKDMK